MIQKSALSRWAVAGLLCGAFVVTSSGARAQVIISEFLTLNDDGLVDEDGDASDWIELLNLAPSAIDLDGWYLTDDPIDLQKWRFPSGVRLQPGDYLVVFASDKDRAISGRELHTSFQLDGGGEFLMLVRPNGTTAEHGYAPQYPVQKKDVSYGLTQDIETTRLVSKDTAATFLVPTAGGLGTSWTQRGFNDSSWTAGALGIGFETADDSNAEVPSEIVNLAPEGTPSQSSTLSGFAASLAIDGDFESFSHTQSNTNLPATWELDLGATYSIDSIVLHNRSACCGSRLRDVTVSILDASGTVTLFESELLNPENVLGQFPDGPPSLAVDLVDITGGVVRGEIVRVVRTPDPDLSGTNGQGNNDEADVLQLGEVEVFGQFSVEPPGFGDLVQSDVEAVMHGLNGSILVRAPFELAGATLPEFLRLRVQYDDGFVAYLNGVEVARRNAPAALDSNSTATAEHPDEQAIVAEEINLSEFRDLLQVGTNVLALHGLNAAPDDTDFLILPELVGQSIVDDAARYFSPPTPGSANASSGILGFVADTKFSVDRGFYDEPFEVEISTLTPGAQIRYTVDGTPPTPTSGPLYDGPLLVDGTTTLRAIAYHPDLEPTNVDTQTYIFRHDIVRQSYQATVNLGFPPSWGSITPDYGMDSDVIGFTGPDLFGGVYQATIQDDLLAVPTLSIVLDTDDMFGARGIYTNSTARGLAWERACSAELILPDGTEGFQVNCGIRIQGGAFRNDGLTKKHSFRLLFKEMYGPTKLRSTFLGPDAVDRFDTLTLRAGANDGYSWDAARLTEQYTRDEFGRSLQLATGNPGSHGAFVHLYINGVYWGLYNPVERPDHSFSASYLGGDKDEWDALNNGTPTNGNLDAWNAMNQKASEAANSLTAYMALQGRNPNGTPNPAIPHLLDVPGYADYLIVNVWGGNWDWPWKNWWATRRRTADSTGWKFYCWDFENTMGNNRGRSPLDKNALQNNFSSAGGPHQSLSQNAEYRLLFADRVQRLFFHGSVLTPESLIPRYAELNSHVERAIVAESARWGDQHHHPPLTLSEWDDERAWILGTYLPQRTAIVLQQIRAAGLYPAIDPPAFSQAGGRIAPGFQFVLRGSAGLSYYTVDGSDPRVLGGAIAPTALVAGEVATVTLVDEQAPVRVLVPSSGALGLDWTAPDFNDSGWQQGVTGVGYERSSGYEDAIGTDVEASLYQVNSSVYLRVPFSIVDPSTVSFLTLRMRYDDGFVAYLNGELVLSQNAPAAPVWDSASTASRESTGFESFDLSAERGLLRAGENVLALHGLNSSSASSDLLILPVLVGTSEASESAITLQRTTKVSTRSYLDGEWSALDEVVFAVDSSSLRITELMFHPPPSDGNLYGTEDFEFIELQNVGDVPLNLTDIRLTGGVSFAFPDGDAHPEDDLQPGEVVLVVRDLDAFSSRYETNGLYIAGEYTGRLGNAGDQLLLLDRLGETLLEFGYSDLWYPIADGLGSSLEVRDPSSGPESWNDPASWTPSATVGGSPGTAPRLPTGEGQVQGDLNQDGILDISDAVALVLHLFVSPQAMPCDPDGTRQLLDVNGDAGVDISDAIRLLNYLFQGGPPPVLGTSCVVIPGCPDNCVR